MRKHITTGVYAELTCYNCGDVFEVGGSTIEEAIATLLRATEAEGWEEINGEPHCGDCAGF